MNTIGKLNKKKRVEEIQHETNINKIIILAEEELLRSKQKHSEKDVDSDWLHCWRENAKGTTNDDLKKLCKALAGEVKCPGSYSLRTLKFMKNISQEEAKTLATLGPFVTNDGILYNIPLLKQSGLTVVFLLKLDELGIINNIQSSHAGLQQNMESRKQGEYFNIIINRECVLIIEAKEFSKILSLDCYRISKIGVEIISLGDFVANAAYMRQLGEKIKSQGFDVKIAQLTQKDITDKGYSIRYINPKQM